MLWNAITGPDPDQTASSLARQQRAVAVKAAKAAERRTPDLGGNAIRVAVPTSQVGAAVAALRSIGVDPVTMRLSGTKQIVVAPNPENLGLEESRQLTRVLPRLQRAGITILWASLPGP